MLTDSLQFLGAPRIEKLALDVGAAYPANPVQGQAFFNTTAGQLAVYDGTKWATSASAYDISLSIEGKPTADAVLLSFVATRAYSIPANFTGSQSKAGTAATGATVFTFKKNGTSIGTLTYAAAGATGAFTGAGAAFVAGDLLTLTAQATPDATLENISITVPAVLA